MSLLASYTYSKSYDQTSNIQEQVDPYDYHRLDGIAAFDLKHDFVVSYNYDLPVARLWHPNRLTRGWALSGITRFASGLPVTFASSGDNYLVQVQNNGVNATSIDMPNYDDTGYKINRNPRKGKPYFNTAAFTPNALGTQGNSKRRMFYRPGIDNYDMALHKVTSFTEGRSLELRLEMFNVFITRSFIRTDLSMGTSAMPPSARCYVLPIHALVKSQQSSVFSGMREAQEPPHSSKSSERRKT